MDSRQTVEVCYFSDLSCFWIRTLLLDKPTGDRFQVVDELAGHDVWVHIQHEVDMVSFSARRLNIDLPLATQFTTDNFQPVQHYTMKAYKYRLCPNAEQKVLIARHFGCAIGKNHVAPVGIEETFQTAYKTTTADYILLYNNHRLHYHPGYMSPVDFEQQELRKAA